MRISSREMFRVSTKHQEIMAVNKVVGGQMIRVPQLTV